MSHLCSQTFSHCVVVTFPSCDRLPSCAAAFKLSAEPRQMCRSWNLLPPLRPRLLGRLRTSPAWRLAGPQPRPLSRPHRPKREFPLLPCSLQAGYLRPHNCRMCRISSQTRAEVLGEGLPADFVFSKNISPPTWSLCKVTFRHFSLSASTSLVHL